jgi:hypothetical protein
MSVTSLKICVYIPNKTSCSPSCTVVLILNVWIVLQDTAHAKKECGVSNIIYGMVRNTDERYATIPSGSG